MVGCRGYRRTFSGGFFLRAERTANAAEATFLQPAAVWPPSEGWVRGSALQQLTRQPQQLTTVVTAVAPAQHAQAAQQASDEDDSQRSSGRKFGATSPPDLKAFSRSARALCQLLPYIGFVRTLKAAKILFDVLTRLSIQSWASGLAGRCRLLAARGGRICYGSHWRRHGRPLGC